MHGIIVEITTKEGIKLLGRILEWESLGAVVKLGTGKIVGVPLAFIKLVKEISENDGGEIS